MTPPPPQPHPPPHPMPSPNVLFMIDILHNDVIEDHVTPDNGIWIKVVIFNLVTIYVTCIL